MLRAKFSFFSHTYDLVGKILIYKLLLTFHFYFMLSKFIFAHLWILFAHRFKYAPKLTRIISGHFLGRHRDGNAVYVVFAERMSRVCVHRCVQDPQQVVTRNRGGYAAARWLPIRQGLCVPLRAPPPMVVAPIVLGKNAVFPLLSFPWPETIIPRLPCRKPCPILVARLSGDFSRLEQCSR